MGNAGIILRVAPPFLIRHVLLPLVIFGLAPIFLYAFPQVYRLFLTSNFVIKPQNGVVNLSPLKLHGHQFYITEGSSTIAALHLVPEKEKDTPFDDVLAKPEYKIILCFRSEIRSIALFANFSHMLLRKNKFQIVAFDYKGFGNSAGPTTRTSAIEDARTVYYWLKKRAPKSEIHFWAHGLGASYAAATAVTLVEDDHQEVRSLVLEAPFVDSFHALEGKFFATTIYGKYIPHKVFYNSLDNIDLHYNTTNMLARLDVPTLILNSELEDKDKKTRKLVIDARKFRDFLFHIEWRCKKVKHSPGFEASKRELEAIIEGFHNATDLYWTPE